MSEARTGSLRGAIPHELPDELTMMLVSSGGVRIERIVSRGHASPPGFWYEQKEAEFVLVVEGSARIAMDGGEEYALEAQDYMFIPAGVRHRVAWTTSERNTVWLAVFLPAEQT